MSKLLIIFFIASILGWVLDTTYRSLTTKKYSPGPYLPLFAPEYGLGVLALIYSFNLSLQPVFQILTGFILILIIEYAFGEVYLRIFKKRFWDYSNNKYNLNGHIDALHSFYWLILTLLAYFIFPMLNI